MGIQVLFTLYEHASGYALFRIKEFEEVGMQIPQVEQSVTDPSKFQSIVQLVAFSPFKSGTNALDNINSISEGLLHEDLKLFLETHVPKPGKKEKVVVGVADSKIGASITEELGIKTNHIGVVPEVLRGIRVHFSRMVKGLNEKSESKAQLGLGHSYSRAKVKFNVNRQDNMIIQSISLLDQLDKNINTFSMRIREWYSYHFPELVKIVNDNYMFAKVARYIGNRKEFDDDKLEGLEEIVMDSAKASAILDASRSSMGMDISPIDLLNIETFATKVISLTDYRMSLAQYLHSKMTQVAPNLATLIGEQVGARLIAHAGSLTNLAKYPASTVQILGAEKALFRALKSKGNTPKYGLIFHSTFIGRAGTQNKGRISRYLANKCSIASRIDCFSEYPTSVFGDHLRQQVEDRLKFYETGDAPSKNVDVMKLAVEEASEVQKKLAKKEKKKKKKDKKRKSEADESAADTTMEADTTADLEDEETSPPKKKKKKKSKGEEQEIAMEMDESGDTGGEEKPKKKKKKKKKDED
ncbi:LOW QUALITY PROTEIN: nucleolar protein 56-like [Pecten maximus]|uniref:LOW QUALITY PROTEIN: nucleolar protein 56-like n=1 Tax=Pecten maximus TaxID=6579 RepID=UPI001458F276|nr:LOW QUALITY PROTEIN: nucleolar protein 56-like [Pecten maximus]